MKSEVLAAAITFSEATKNVKKLRCSDCHYLDHSRFTSHGNVAASVRPSQQPTVPSETPIPRLTGFAARQRPIASCGAGIGACQYDGRGVGG